MNRHTFLPLVVISLFLLHGCAPSTPIPLAVCEGIVKYRGQEVSGATIEMRSPDGKHIAKAVTDEYGWFRMQTEVDGQWYTGAPIGEVQIRIVKVVSQGNQRNVSAEDVIEMTKGRLSNDEGIHTTRSVLPDRYKEFESSALVERIRPNGGENRFTFVLTD